MNFNKVILVGNLTRDPELRSLPSGQPVVSFGLATNRNWKGQDGEKKQDTQFHNIVMFGRLAEIANQYLKKGSLTLVEGRIQTRSWDGQDGQKKYRTEIVAESMQLGPRPANQAQNPQTTDEKPQQNSDEQLDTVEYGDDEEEINPDEIPF